MCGRRATVAEITPASSRATAETMFGVSGRGRIVGDLAGRKTRSICLSRTRASRSSGCFQMDDSYERARTVGFWCAADVH